MIRKGGFRIEDVLGSKTVWRILRLLVDKPYLGYALSDIAKALKTSTASVLRSIRKLEEEELIVVTKIGGRRIYRANTEQEIIRELWRMFMLEKMRNIQPEYKNAIELLFSKAEKRVEAFIVFGSIARGLAGKESDIDICVVNGEELAKKRFEFLPYRFEIHTHDREGFECLEDFVVLDSLLNGIVFKGADFVFNILKDLRSFPKDYLLYRLAKVKQFIERSRKTKGAAKDYYNSLAKVGLAEIESILHRRTVVSKREVGRMENIKAIENELAKKGERIWLI